MPNMSMLFADFDQSQLLMLAGFIMLGWVLARRTIKRRPRMIRSQRETEKTLHALKNPVQHSVPLSDAPVETQRWQVAMMDLQRELTGELDTRIAIVQSLLQQVDQRVRSSGGELPPYRGSLATETGTASELASRASSLTGPCDAGCDTTSPSADEAACFGTSRIDDAVQDASTAEIVRLYRLGFICEEIAQSTGVPVGDVELIVSATKV
ncbi:MAG: hypothetical protein AAGA03_02520 [Planctomycetota bacterium]